MATTLSWCKRSLVEDDHHPLDKLEKLDTKRSKYYYYYILESESSSCSDDADATESVYSVQDKTTDTVRDTTDTDTKTENEFELEIEYEVASLSGGSDQDTCSVTSSEPEDIMLAAAAICDSSLDAFITDAEDSDDDSSVQELDDSSAHSLLDFWLCIQCKCQNDNPQFQYCDKCFQDRKTTLPVRPRRFKKTKQTNKTTTTRIQSRAASPVKLDALKSCLSSLSDSGLGSSQELPKLCLDQIYVPSTSTTQSSQQQQQQQEASSSNNNPNRKRNISESSQSEYELPQPSKKSRTTNSATTNKNQKKNEDKTIIDAVNNNLNEAKTNDDSNVCIACQNAPKNSIFLHGRIAHMCCCYKCAMRTWKLSKRCPICNRLVNNVVRVFTT